MCVPYAICDGMVDFFLISYHLLSVFVVIVAAVLCALCVFIVRKGRGKEEDEIF